jgi:sec-independent protein translocase protein TatC
MPEEMGFLDHLEELRARLTRGLIGVLIVFLVCAFFSDFIVNEILIRPLRMSSQTIKLQNLVPYGQVSLYLQALLFSSLILAFPIIAYQIWMFIAPGLMPNERGAARFMVFFVSICFFSGVAFGYFIVIPFSLKFFADFGSPYIENNISVTDYVSFFMAMLLTAGLIFELPFVSYVLSKIGLLTPPFMREYRRHALVAILILSAIITPTTDAVTMSFFAAPMYLLYEISIGISALVQKNKRKKEQAEAYS